MQRAADLLFPGGSLGNCNICSFGSVWLFAGHGEYCGTREGELPYRAPRTSTGKRPGGTWPQFCQPLIHSSFVGVIVCCTPEAGDAPRHPRRFAAAAGKLPMISTVT